MMPGSIESVFDVVGRKLPKAGVEFLMIGGHAVNHYGYSRATIDVDFMIAASDQKTVLAVMKKAGYTNISQSENVIFFSMPGVPVRVDFLQVDDATMGALLGDAEEVDYGGQSVRVPSLANLIAMKLFALKSGSSNRWEKDFPDIVHLAIENELELETDLKPLCERFADVAVYEKLAARIQEQYHD